MDSKIQVFSEILYTVRRGLGLSAQELGELVGVTRQTINNVESGKHELSKTLYLALRYVLDPLMTGFVFSLVQIVVDHPERYTMACVENTKTKVWCLADRLYTHKITEEQAREEWLIFWMREEERVNA